MATLGLSAQLLPRCGTPAQAVQSRARASPHAVHRPGPRAAPCWRAVPALRGVSRPQPRGRAPARPPRAAIAAPAAAVAAVSHTLLQTLASLLGMVMGAGSLLLYSPIVLRLVRTRSAEGMALSTWALQLFGFTAGVLYNATKGFPLTAYAETLSFTVQSAAILVLVAHLQRRLRTPAFAAGGVVYVCLCVAGLRGMPPWALSTLQLAATVSVTGALVPQLLLNARRRSGGGWSPLTAGLSAAGNAVRVFTTVQLTRDPLLLGGFLAGFAVNAALLAQIFIYGDDPAKETAPA